MPTDLLSAVTDFMQKLVADLSLPGAVLVLVKDGQIGYARAFGGYTLDRRVPVASAAKWVSGAIFARLLEQGVLHLDDQVGDYLEAFSGEKAKLTLRQLLAHTSGLPTRESPCLRRGDISLQACAAEIAQMPLESRPGTAFAYGENSFQVAGAMAEVATGQPWAQLFETLIAQPIGMVSSDYEGMTRSPFAPTNPRIGSGLRTTAMDYAGFLTMLLNDGSFGGRQVLQPTTVKLIGEDHTFGARVRASPNLHSAAGYGLGCWREESDQNAHAVTLSSPGAFGCFPWLDRARGVAGILLTRDAYHRIAPRAHMLQALVAALM
ncbi:MAG: serine hydrolase domain-containing protein [Anaerolineae bacterium]|nr:serine hydrolase domain-containing protein [Anaerolineae bacterium]